MLDDSHPGVRRAVREELTALPPDDGPDLAREIRALRSATARRAGLRAILARKEDVTLFAGDRDPSVAARALAMGRVALPAIRDALRQRAGLTRACALEALRDPAEARRLLRDPAEEVRIACARVADDDASIALLLKDRSWRVRLAAILATERLRVAALVPRLFRLVEGRPGRVRARAAAALETLTQAPFGEDAAKWKRWWSKVERDYRLPPARNKPVDRPHTTTASIKFRRIPIVSRRICFVLDASRSMTKVAPGGGGKTRWELVVRDVTGVLERVPAATRFNIILFRTGVEAWKPRLVSATSGAKAACTKWIKKQSPAGWTNLFDSVALALEDSAVDTLYILTDGVPSRGSETDRRGILEEVAFLNRYRLAQINCVQAGSAEGLGKRWRGFLDDLAKAHDGQSVRE